MKNYLLIAFLLISLSSVAQDLNKYKYAIIPTEFSFLDGPDQYRMNTFTRMHMEKYGFETFMDDAILPPEIASDNCNRIYVDVVSSGTLFTSKLNVVIRDCTNAIIYTSPTGSSREKDNKIAYPQALREAFSYFDQLNYKYDDAPTRKVVAKVTEVKTVNPAVGFSGTFSAKPVSGGYTIMNEENQVVLVLRNTSAEGVFIAEKTDVNGIFFNKMGKWHFEFYDNGKLVSEILQVRF